MTGADSFRSIRLAGTDVVLPPLGLGTWAWGDSSTWGMRTYDRSYGLDTIGAAYDRSIAAGVTLLDTAEVYGRGESERIIGGLLASNPDNRGQVIVATKFMPFPWRLSLASALMSSLHASLDRVAKPGQRKFSHMIWQHG